MNSYKLKSLLGTLFFCGLFLALCYIVIKYVPGKTDSAKICSEQAEFKSLHSKLENPRLFLTQKFLDEKRREAATEIEKDEAEKKADEKIEIAIDLGEEEPEPDFLSMLQTPEFKDGLAALLTESRDEQIEQPAKKAAPQKKKKEDFSTLSLAQNSLSATAFAETLGMPGTQIFNSASFELAYSNAKVDNKAGYNEDYSPVEDSCLALYRQQQSRPAVEWFFSHITNNREVAQAILENADKNGISPTLAFALAYVESRYKATAVNHNANESVDRGLFQLNSKTFPKLTESDFFNPRTSAKYGMKHLRYCLDIAGNELTALAIYNAGTYRVKTNNTPEQTLKYVAKISRYKKSLDNQFSTEVLAFYSTDARTKALAMLTN